jgi:hypothetical protein
MALILTLLMQRAPKPRPYDKDGWALTRDGRRIGKDCNPCAEGPAPDYVPPSLPPGEPKTMVGQCSPQGMYGESNPSPWCLVAFPANLPGTRTAPEKDHKTKEKSNVSNVSDQH